jgi:hypothetical protein
MVENTYIGVTSIGVTSCSIAWYFIRNSMLGENLICWIDQLYGIEEFDLHTIIKENIKELFKKYDFPLENVNIDFVDLGNLTPICRVIESEDQTILSIPEKEFLIYVQGLNCRNMLNENEINYPGINLDTKLNTVEQARKIIRITDEFPTEKERYEKLQLLKIIYANKADMEEYVQFSDKYQEKLYENFKVFQKSMLFSERKFLNVSLSDLLTSRTHFKDVIKNFVKGLYNFFKGYMSQTVETPLDVTNYKFFNISVYPGLESVFYLDKKK